MKASRPLTTRLIRIDREQDTEANNVGEDGLVALFRSALPQRCDQ